MLHSFFEEGDWFPPKRYGYGAGLPIAWQGWVLLAAHLMVVLGMGFWAANADGDLAQIGAATIGIILATGVLIVIARKRTRGGWRWRSGEDR